MRSVFAKYFIQDILNSVSETAYPDSASESVANRRAGFASKDEDYSLIFKLWNLPCAKNARKPRHWTMPIGSCNRPASR